MALESTGCEDFTASACKFIVSFSCVLFPFSCNVSCAGLGFTVNTTAVEAGAAVVVCSG